MASVDEINSYMDAAVAALDGGDYATARLKAVCAQGLMSVIPKSAKGNSSLEYSAEGIRDFIAGVRAAEKAASAGNSSTAVRRTKITYVTG